MIGFYMGATLALNWLRALSFFAVLKLSADAIIKVSNFSCSIMLLKDL